MITEHITAWMKNAGKSEQEILAFLEQKGVQVRPSVSEIEYWQRVYAEEAEQAEIGVTEARAMYGKMRQTVEALPSGNWKAVEALHLALIASGTGIKSIAEKAGIDLNKGLLVVGSVGTGKTTAFELAKAVGAIKFRTASCIDIAKDASRGGYEAIETWEKGTVYFDDLGIEPSAISYGQRIEPIQDLIFARYQLHQREGKLTHFSSNLSLDELADKYDRRVVDRLKGICNVIQLKNEQSFR